MAINVGGDEPPPSLLWYGAHVSAGIADRVLVHGPYAMTLFDANGVQRGQWASPGWSVESALGPDGGVYVRRAATSFTSLLDRFDESGKRTWSVPIEAGAGTGIALSDRLAFATMRLRGAVAVLDAVSGERKGQLQMSGADDLFLPFDVAVGSGGRLYALDYAREQLQVWDLSVSALRPVQRVQVGAEGDEVQPFAVAASPDGAVALLELVRGLPTATQRVRVVDGSGATLWTLAGATPPPAMTATPAPTPLPANAGLCQVTGDKRAAPVEIWLGEAVTVTLTLRQTCPTSTGPADIVLAVDRSGSMAGSKAEAMGEAVQAFVGGLDLGRHRLGVVTFGSSARLVQPLTNDRYALAALPRSFGAAGSTNMHGAMSVAADHLRSAGRPGVKQVIVLFTDGGWNTGGDPVPLAEQARQEGVRIFAVGTTDADMETLIRIAGAVERVYYALNESDLPKLFRQIADLIGSDAGGVALDDVLGRDVALIPGSISAPPLVMAGASLRWAWPGFAVAPMTITYRVRPQRAGWLPTNEQAWFDYEDADQVVRRFAYPVPTVHVKDRSTATPTPSRTPIVTPTATATHRPAKLYLPLALREPPCQPGMQRIDAALVIDTSTSMQERTSTGRQKLDAARDAAAAFLDRLRLADGDQAAVVYFNREAHQAQSLTSDRRALDRALIRPPTATQTCLVCGVQLAYDELRSPRHHSGSKPVMVILTDGLSNPRPASEALALALARSAKDSGIMIDALVFGIQILPAEPRLYLLP